MEEDETPPLPFAGTLLHGRIDRIDRDPEGRAIVIDYKSRLQDGHRLKKPEEGAAIPAMQDGAAPSAILPLHSQILMYAAALKASGMGCDPQGALYMGYAKSDISGFVDPSVAISLEARVLKPEAHVNCFYPGLTFDTLLSGLEDAVREAVFDHLYQGDIEPNPRFGSQSCTWCAIASQCPRRQS